MAGLQKPPQTDGSAVSRAEYPLPRPCPCVGAVLAGVQARGGSGCLPQACCPLRVCSAPARCGSWVPGRNVPTLPRSHRGQQPQT